MTLEISNLDIIGAVLGAVFTLMVLSYLLGDNPLYRLALHLFVGALTGYSFSIMLREVIYEKVVTQLRPNPLIVVPLVLGLLIIFKGFPNKAYVGNFSVAFLVGVGSAVALSGALLGILIPQIGATGQALSSLKSLGDYLNGTLVILGTIFTVLAFTFTTQREEELPNLWTQLLTLAGDTGRLFLVFTFGAAFGGALTASLSIFIGRIQSIIDLVFNFIAGS